MIHCLNVSCLKGEKQNQKLNMQLQSGKKKKPKQKVERREERKESNSSSIRSRSSSSSSSSSSHSSPSSVTGCLHSTLRRSDRIKTLETWKQQNKELEIAKKLKRHNEGGCGVGGTYQRTESSSNLDVADLQQPSPLRPHSLFNEDDSTTNMSLGSHVIDSVVSPSLTNTNIEITATEVPATNPEQVEFCYPAEFECIDKNIYVAKR